MGKDSPRPRILWVDDEPHTLRYACSMLEERGVKVDWACDTDEAIQCLEKTTYKLILLDCMLPSGMENTSPVEAGVEFLRKLRSGKIGGGQENTDVPVVAITAIADLSLRNALRERGIIGIMTKPLLPDEICGKVMEVLEQEKTRE